MGFNVSVCGPIDAAYEYGGEFINRSYYNFVASYDLFEDKSIIVQAGKYFDLDLSPLLQLAYLDDFEEGDEAEVEQDIDQLIGLTTAFLEKFRNEPSMIDKISYQAKSFQYATWKEYFHSGQVIEDFEAIVTSLAGYKKAGETKVFFGVC